MDHLSLAFLSFLHFVFVFIFDKTPALCGWDEHVNSTTTQRSGNMTIAND